MMKILAMCLALLVSLVILGCSDTDQPAKGSKDEQVLPTVAFGSPYLYPESKLPKNVVAVYLDGPLIECEGHTIEKDDVTSFVTEQLMERATQVVFIFTTPDVHFGQVTEVVDKVRKAPVKWVRIDDRMIPTGYRFQR